MYLIEYVQNVLELKRDFIVQQIEKKCGYDAGAVQLDGLVHEAHNITWDHI